MPPHSVPFQYPVLPADVDAIRVLTIEPGDFLDGLVCTLVPIAFSERPKYVALSYTWGNPYLDKSKPSSRNFNGLRGRVETPPPGQESSAASDFVCLTMNGQTFQIRYNLNHALLYLRSPTYPITIWADAICINQADEKERNKQVSLMSFIYTRATNVVVWLGTKDYSSTVSQLRPMSIEWKAGLTQHFAAALAGASKMRCSPKPDLGTFTRIAQSTYWTRLWIVQEVCLPRFLVFCYGSSIWTHEEFQKWDFTPAVTHDGHGAMLRLLESREERHTDMMTLERLVERFADNDCSELRDKVYGLLGCANDIYPFVGRDDKEDSLTSYINSLSTGLRPQYEPRRGMGSLKIDYSSSFYDIWTRVVCFVFFQAKNLEGRIHVTRIENEAKGQATGGEVDVLPNLNEERRISIVRTAGVVQAALGHKVEEEVANLSHTAGRLDDPPVIRAIGYIAGRIVELGPDCMSLIAASRSRQDWISCWADHYQKAEDMETLRRIDEEYMAKILSWEKTDMDRIRVIRNPYVRAWHVAQDNLQPRFSDMRYAAEYETTWADTGANEQGPRICLGTGYVIGLVPSAARLGDIVVRFWNCDSAVIMRPIKTSIAAAEATSFMLIGRADAAEVCNRKATPGRDPHAEQCMSGLGAADPGSVEGSQHSGAVYVDLSLTTLQSISAYIAT